MQGFEPCLLGSNPSSSANMKKKESMLVKPNQLGYLSREGKMHWCSAWGHNDLAYDLTGDVKGDPDSHLMKMGWMTLRGDPGIDKFNWFYLASRPAFPSKRQWDFVFDWCAKNKKSFPPLHLDMLWEDQNE